jgi:hypothetical protein
MYLPNKGIDHNQCQGSKSSQQGMPNDMELNNIAEN